MSFKIIVDSCCDLTTTQFQLGPFVRVPLTLSVDRETVVDDDTFDQTRLLRLMGESSKPPRTACPAPAQYLDAFAAADADDLYVVTLSALLSGSYNSAVQARSIWLEEHPESNVHIFNSCTAAAGEVCVAWKLFELARTGEDFAAVVDQASRYISSLTTYFVLEDLDHLRKNGRLTGALSLATEVLRIKLLMGATPAGEIRKVGQALSTRQALSKMVSLMAADPAHEGKILSIVHCNNVKGAYYVKELVMKSCRFRDILVSDARGVTSVYANDGGVVVAF